jgi:hypothetical protein
MRFVLIPLTLLTSFETNAIHAAAVHQMGIKWLIATRILTEPEGLTPQIPEPDIG